MTATESELFQQGVQLHQQQNLAEAEQAYRAFLRHNPNHADCLHQLGALLVQQYGAKQYKEAARLVQSAIQLAPSNARYRHSLGVIHEAAEQWSSAADAFERAVEKRPNDIKAHMHLARALKSAGQAGRSADVYRSVLQLQPNHPTAHYKLGSVLRHMMGKHEAAAEAYRQHLQKDPNHVQAAFWLAALTPGPQVSACPPEIVSKLFDGYSDHFDDHLVNKLGYKTPAMLMDCILQFSAQQQEQQQQQQSWSHCVDLGCGTGLMGPLLRPHAQQLAGVDLSSGMVAKAEERGCYDQLAVDELVHYLAEAAAAVEGKGAQPFDLLVAADVFVYIGDLKPVLEAAAAVSTDRAVFAFSTELLKGAESEQQPQPRQQQQQPQQQSAADASSQTSSSSSSSASSGSYVLQPTGRYAHSPAYLRQVAAATGWQVAVLQEAQIRQNAGQPIWGSLCILQRVDNAL